MPAGTPGRVASLASRLPRPPVTEADFTSRLHDERLAARLGLWLGAAFGICFVTGVLSSMIQQPPGWFVWPTRPVGLYRWTQGAHIVTGVATVPLLLAKLWTVYPRLLTWPPVTSVVHALERVAVLVLVAAAFFQVVTGIQNAASWYPWGFFFPPVHNAMAWVLAGAVLVHVGAKLPVTRRALRAPLDGGDSRDGDDEPSRRAVLVGAVAAAGVAALAVAGQTVPWLRSVAVLAARSGEGPQGLPVNKSAVSAGVVAAASDPAWRLVVAGPDGEVVLSRDDLLALEQVTADLPIACVQGWSATATWTGPRLRDVVALAGARPGAADVRVVSLQRRGAYRASTLPAPHAGDDLTLLALRIGGDDLVLDHGYPCRLVAPSRPGATQTKWVSRLEVAA